MYTLGLLKVAITLEVGPQPKNHPGFLILKVGNTTYQINKFSEFSVKKSDYQSIYCSFFLQGGT